MCAHTPFLPNNRLCEEYFGRGGLSTGCVFLDIQDDEQARPVSIHIYCSDSIFLVLWVMCRGDLLVNVEYDFPSLPRLPST